MTLLARILLVALILAAAAPLAVAADYTVFPHWIESHLADEQLEVTSVSMIEVLSQPYLLATTPFRGLVFYRPTADGLELVSDFGMGGREVDVAVTGYNAYVAGDGPNPLLSRVIIAAPASPSVIWQAALPAEPRSVRVSGDLAILPCGSDGLLLFDLTEQFGQPGGVVGQWSGNVRDALMIDGLLHVLSSQGLHVLDVTDPAAPNELAFLPLFPYSVMTWHQDRLVIGGAVNGLMVIDVSDPLSPQVEMTVPADTGAVAMAGVGDELYVVSGNDYRVLGPDFAVRWVAPARMDANLDIAAGHGLIVIGTEERGLHVLADGLHSPAPTGPAASMGGYNPMARQLVDDRLYFSFSRTVTAYGLDAGDLYPAWSHLSPTPNDYVDAVHVADGRAYIGYSSGVIEFVNAAGAPEQLGVMSLGSGAQILDLVWTGSVLAVLYDPDGIHGEQVDRVSTYDLTVPAQPLFLDSVNVGYQTYIHAFGDVLALWSWANVGTSVELIDASDPANLRPAGSHPKPPFSRVTASGAYLDVSGAETLQVLRIVSADEIVGGPVQTVPVSSAQHRFHRAGDVGYLSQADLLYDLSDPMAPRPVGSFSKPDVSAAYTLFANSEHLVPVTSGMVYRLPAQGSDATPVIDDPSPSVPAAATRLLAAPNPFNPIVSLSFSMPRPGPAWLEIFDARGRRLLERRLTVVEAGEQSVTWDGRDEDGRTLPSGTYVARVRATDVHAVAKVVLAK